MRNDEPSVISKLSVETSDLKFTTSFDGSHESLYWVQPLADDKKSEFVTWKRAGIPLDNFDYTFKGKTFTCEPKSCVMTTDQFRGHHNYGMAFYFALIQGVTE